MQVSTKIDQPTDSLITVNSEPLEQQSKTTEQFKQVLADSVKDNLSQADNTESKIRFSERTVSDTVPSWVDPSYGFDPQNPRKPNMRELLEAMSGKSLEDLYKEPEKNWQKISSQASQMLYGVIGANEDTRDWPSIMSSNDILAEAREQTGDMYKPVVDIQSYFNDDGVLTEQIALIKDNKGNTLSSLPNHTTSAEEELLNFGATKESIPTNLEEQIDAEKFDDDLLALLKNFDNSPSSIQQVVVQNASEAIANKISQEIPLDELAKL